MEIINTRLEDITRNNGVNLNLFARGHPHGNRALGEASHQHSGNTAATQTAKQNESSAVPHKRDRFFYQNLHHALFTKIFTNGGRPEMEREFRHLRQGDQENGAQTYCRQTAPEGESVRPAQTLPQHRICPDCMEGWREEQMQRENPAALRDELQHINEYV